MQGEEREILLILLQQKKSICCTVNILFLPKQQVIICVEKKHYLHASSHINKRQAAIFEEGCVHRKLLSFQKQQQPGNIVAAGVFPI